MPQKVGQGGTIVLPVIIRDGAGTLVDPVDLLVDIINPATVEVVTNGVPVRISTGRYEYTYALDPTAPQGDWQVHWTGTVAGLPATVNDSFTVVEAGTIQVESVADIDLVRWFTDENPVGQEVSKFSDTMLANLLGRHTNNVYSAAADVWAMKAARYAKLIDRNGGGDINREYSTLYRNAAQQATRYRDLANTYQDPRYAVLGRGVVGKAINLRESPVSGDPYFIDIVVLEPF